MRVTKLLALPLAFLTVCASDPLLAVDERARVDALFERWNRSDAPGGAVAIVHQGRVVHMRGFGMADIEKKIPITPATVFDIASASKQFTAGCVTLLVQQGKLSLEDDVRRWVKELPAYDPPVRIRHLVHHTSGIAEYDYDHVDTMDEALASIVSKGKTTFPAGSKHEYCNSGYVLLALVVQRASGKSLRDFARDGIFLPLGMRSSAFNDDLKKPVPGVARGYTQKDGGGWEIEEHLNQVVGDGSLCTTVQDLVLWDRNFEGNRVGAPGFLEFTLTRGRTESGEQLEYAMGLEIEDHRGMRRIKHTGSWDGFSSGYFRYPDQRLSVIVLFNDNEAGPQAIAEEIVDIYVPPDEKGAGDDE